MKSLKFPVKVLAISLAMFAGVSDLQAQVAPFYSSDMTQRVQLPDGSWANLNLSFVIEPPQEPVPVYQRICVYFDANGAKFVTDYYEYDLFNEPGLSCRVDHYGFAIAGMIDVIPVHYDY